VPHHPGTRPEANRLVPPYGWLSIQPGADLQAGRYLFEPCNEQCFTYVLDHVTITRGIIPSFSCHKMIVRKTARIFGVSLALIALLVFATGVVSDWHHSDSTNDAHCPYCHLGHQVPIQPEAALCVAVLRPISALPLLEVVVPATGPVFSQIAPRAPPSA